MPPKLENRAAMCIDPRTQCIIHSSKVCHEKIFRLGKKRGAVLTCLKFSAGALRTAGTMKQGAKLLHSTSLFFFFPGAPPGVRVLRTSELSFFMLLVVKNFCRCSPRPKINVNQRAKLLHATGNEKICAVFRPADFQVSSISSLVGTPAILDYFAARGSAPTYRDA